MERERIGINSGLAVLGYREIWEYKICILAIKEVLVFVPATQLYFPRLQYLQWLKISGFLWDTQFHLFFSAFTISPSTFHLSDFVKILFILLSSLPVSLCVCGNCKNAIFNYISSPPEFSAPFQWAGSEDGCVLRDRKKNWWFPGSDTWKPLSLLNHRETHSAGALRNATCQTCPGE